MKEIEKTKKRRELTVPMAVFGFFVPLLVILFLLSQGVSIMLALAAGYFLVMTMKAMRCIPMFSI